MIEDVARAVTELRAARPLVQCLTNKVVPQITADALLAAGATPAMVDTSEEAAAFAAVTDAVLINVGTVTSDAAQAMRSAAEVADRRGIGWVLDPVAVGVLGFRTRFARDLLASRPTVIRGNASEILALSGDGQGGRGVDATDAVDAAVTSAAALARASGAVVAVSGSRDLIVATGRPPLFLESGHEMMQWVIGTGCALGALVAAYTKVCADPVLAALAAHAHAGAAGTLAGRAAPAPGSFSTAWLDALYLADEQTIRDIIQLHILDSVEPAGPGPRTQR
ncbi:MAG: hydroxyethylthiazole kinase [Micrococcales bacterium]|nr:MAG: hydroxyethylthiazole kinase [Micrococcales bacterium]